MPPRYAYWTILVDGGPTAFRAAEPDELLPTLKRLQVKQPGATMKWFEKGKLWESREEAKDKLSAGYTVGPDGALVPPPEGAERRTKSWRPGGEHRDPREKYLLAKKAKWQKFKQMVRARPGHGPKPEEDAFAPLDAPDDPHAEAAPFEPETFDRPDGPSDDTGRDDAGRDDTGNNESRRDDSAPPSTDWRGRAQTEGRAPAPKRAWIDRPKTFDRGSDRPRGPKPAWRDKPQGGWSGKPGGGTGARPAWKPRPDARGPKPEWHDKPKTFDRSDDRPRGPKPEWRDRPKPPGDRPFGDRPRGPKPEWRDKPQGGWSGKPGGGTGARPAWKPRPDARGPKPEWRDKPTGPKPEWRGKPKTFDRSDDRPRGPKPEWRDRPKPPGDRPFGDRPRGPKPEWRDRPAGDRPRGPKPGGGGGFGERPRGRSGPPKKKY